VGEGPDLGAAPATVVPRVRAELLAATLEAMVEREVAAERAEPGEQAAAISRLNTPRPFQPRRAAHSPPADSASSWSAPLSLPAS
jgi:hypothetical protein